MLSQGVTHECRAVCSHFACGAVGSHQQFLVKNDLIVSICRAYSTVHSTVNFLAIRVGSIKLLVMFPAKAKKAIVSKKESAAKRTAPKPLARGPQAPERVAAI